MYGANPGQRTRALTEIERLVDCPTCKALKGQVCGVGGSLYAGYEHAGDPHDKRRIAAEAQR